MLPTRAGGLCKNLWSKEEEVSISNPSSVSSPSCLFTRPEGAPRYGPLGQHDSDGLHNESTRRALFEALFTLVECLLKWAQHNLHSLRAMYVPGKLNLGRRHAVMEQRLLRRVDSPSASGSGNMGDLWQGRG